ncbi:MAG: metal-sulfur cluster assembly factor [Patescibacteria group bacterium]
MKLTREQIIEALKTVKDPELGIDIVTLGLVYDVYFNEDGITVLMTMTTPFCPFADDIIADVEKRVRSLKAGEAKVEITFDPPWEPPKELRDKLGI